MKVYFKFIDKKYIKVCTNDIFKVLKMGCISSFDTHTKYHRCAKVRAITIKTAIIAQPTL